MVKKIIILSGLLICYALVNAQTDSTKAKSPIIPDSSKSQLMADPTFVINGRQIPDRNIINYLKRAKDIKNVSIPLNEQGFGVIVVTFTLKRNVRLLSLHELLKKFNVKKADWQLNVYVNNERLIYPDEFYVGSKWVKKVTVVTAPTAEINEQKYIVLSK